MPWRRCWPTVSARTSSGVAVPDPRAGLAAMLAGCRVTGREGFSLDSYDPRPAKPAGLDKVSAVPLLAAGIARLAALQERLYARSTWSVLLILQAMDTAGKDSTISHVMSGVNPQGVTVTAFKAPGPEDLAHDFLWRPVRTLPARGMIGLFNRSYYEDVLVPRVHPEALQRQHLPAALTGKPGFWDGRLDDIAAFERHLDREGTRVVKVVLNLSLPEQRRRLLARLDDPAKLWKFDPTDIGERAHWNDYRAAYAAATATPQAPWLVIPADRKWLMRLLVLEALVATLDSLDLDPSVLSPAAMAALAEDRRQLAAEDLAGS